MLEPTPERIAAGGFGPGLIDERIREAILICWVALPEQQRSLERVEQEINRIVKRAFDNFRDDLKVLTSFVPGPDRPHGGSEEKREEKRDVSD